MEIGRVIGAVVSAVIFERWGRPKLEQLLERYSQEEGERVPVPSVRNGGTAEAGVLGGAAGSGVKRGRPKKAEPPAKREPERTPTGRLTKAEREKQAKRLDNLAKAREARAKKLAAKRAA
jgi:hypothetical protein